MKNSNVLIHSFCPYRLSEHYFLLIQIQIHSILDLEIEIQMSLVTSRLGFQWARFS
jgi:hypothetical protein